MRLIKKTIAECLRSRVRESANCIALEADKQKYTWRDLDTLSDYMVGRMLSCGIKRVRTLPSGARIPQTGSLYFWL